MEICNIYVIKEIICNKAVDVDFVAVVVCDTLCMHSYIFKSTAPPLKVVYPQKLVLKT